MQGRRFGVYASGCKLPENDAIDFFVELPPFVPPNELPEPPFFVAWSIPETGLWSAHRLSDDSFGQINYAFDVVIVLGDPNGLEAELETDVRTYFAKLDPNFSEEIEVGEDADQFHEAKYYYFGTGRCRKRVRVVSPSSPGAFTNLLEYLFLHTLAHTVVVFFCGHGDPEGNIYLGNESFSGTDLNTLFSRTLAAKTANGFNLPKIVFTADCCFADEFCRKAAGQEVKSFGSIFKQMTSSDQIVPLSQDRAPGQLPESCDEDADVQSISEPPSKRPRVAQKTDRGGSHKKRRKLSKNAKAKKNGKKKQRQKDRRKLSTTWRYIGQLTGGQGFYEFSKWSNFTFLPLSEQRLRPQGYLAELIGAPESAPQPTSLSSWRTIREKRTPLFAAEETVMKLKVRGNEAPPNEDAPLQVLAFPAGAGDCFLFRWHDLAVLVDGGLPPRLVCWDYLHQHCNELNLVVVTHSDEDHINGLLALFSRKALETKEEHTQEPRAICIRNLLALAPKKKGKRKIKPARNPAQAKILVDFAEQASIPLLDLSDEIPTKTFISTSHPTAKLTVTILHPGKELREEAAHSLAKLAERYNYNKSSFILHFKCEESPDFVRHILFTGDADGAAVRKALHTANTDFDLVVVPHHGSSANEPKHWLTPADKTQPKKMHRLVISTSGSRHSLPNEETLKTISQAMGQELVQELYFNYSWAPNQKTGTGPETKKKGSKEERILPFVPERFHDRLRFTENDNTPQAILL
eukprot:TRINITY_DN19072_c0_g1_i1.p1 TRINITY_DN19072_c0_g1~~TRINITY_DN19072_c0_g1_i1.p1  ORF type:complete len:747 (-),score=101.52 TRINITY_DN19072_c0_g1_i1:49-2289(-)